MPKSPGDLSKPAGKSRERRWCLCSLAQNFEQNKNILLRAAPSRCLRIREGEDFAALAHLRLRRGGWEGGSSAMRPTLETGAAKMRQKQAQVLFHLEPSEETEHQAVIRLEHDVMQNQ